MKWKTRFLNKKRSSAVCVLMLPFSFVIILPSMEESLQARINAYEALSEIIPLKNCLGSIFILDNNKRKDKLSINRSFSGLFDSFINIGDVPSSIYGVIDIAEQKTLLETSGVAMIHKVAQNEQSSLLATVNDGIYATIEPNKKIKYIGLSQPEAREDKSPIEINFVIDVVGQPIDTYMGYGNTETVLYLGGMSFPKTYIDSLADSIKEENGLDSSSHSKIFFALSTLRLIYRKLERMPSPIVKKCLNKDQSLFCGWSFKMFYDMMKLQIAFINRKVAIWQAIDAKNSFKFLTQ